MKKLIRLLLVLILVIIIAAVVLLLSANSLIKTGVEKGGTMALGVPTRVEAVDLGIFQGTLALDNLHVGNPSGYKSESLMDIGRCSTAVNLASLRSDNITIDTINISDLVLTIEQKGGQSNLQTVLDTIKAKQSDEPEPAPKEGETPSKQVTLKTIEITNATARVKTDITGDADIIKITLPKLVIEDISPQRSKADMIAEVTQKVLLALSQAVVESSAKLPDTLVKGLDSSLTQAEKAVEGLGKELQSGIDKVLKQGKEDGGGDGTILDGLFQKKESGRE